MRQMGNQVDPCGYRIERTIAAQVQQHLVTREIDVRDVGQAIAIDVSSCKGQREGTSAHVRQRVAT